MSDRINQIDLDAVLSETLPMPIIPEPIVSVSGTTLLDDRAYMLQEAMKAALHGDHEACRKALNAMDKFENSNITIHSTTENGMNLAHYAALGNNDDILNMLNKLGVDLNAQDIDGKTPLDWVNDRTFRNNLRRSGVYNIGDGNFIGKEYEPENPQIAEYLEFCSYAQDQSKKVGGTLNRCSENLTERPIKETPLITSIENIR